MDDATHVQHESSQLSLSGSILTEISLLRNSKSYQVDHQDDSSWLQLELAGLPSLTKVEKKVGNVGSPFQHPPPFCILDETFTVMTPP